MDGGCLCPQQSSLHRISNHTKNSHSLFTAAAADNALAPVDLQSLCVSGFLCNCTCSRLNHCCYWVFLSGAHFLVRVYVVRSHAVHLNVVVNNFYGTLLLIRCFFFFAFCTFMLQRFILHFVSRANLGFLTSFRNFKTHFNY